MIFDEFDDFVSLAPLVLLIFLKHPEQKTLDEVKDITSLQLLLVQVDRSIHCPFEPVTESDRDVWSIVCLEVTYWDTMLLHAPLRDVHCCI